MDEIWNGRPVADADPGAAESKPEAADDSWRHPATLGLTAFALAVLSLLGAEVFRGVLYTSTFAPGAPGLGVALTAGGNRYVVGGSFLTAAFALIPLALARLGLRRLVPDDATWVAHVLRAALLLSVLSVVLHLALAVLQLLAPDPSGPSVMLG